MNFIIGFLKNRQKKGVLNGQAFSWEDITA